MKLDICKRGRMTNCTIGSTNGTHSATKLGPGVFMITFCAVLLSPNPFFSMASNSSSWLMDQAGQLVGMLYAGRTTAKDVGPNGAGSVEVEDVHDVTYFTPAQYLFQMI